LVQGVVQVMRRAITLIALLGLGLVPVLTGRGEQQSSLETTTDVLECVFTHGDQPRALQDPNVLWFVRGRVIPHVDPEWQYTVKQMSDGSLEVELLSVEGGKLLGGAGTASARTCAELLSWAKVDRRVLKAEQCAPLREEISRLKRLTLPTIPDASIRLDSSEYLITAGTAEGDEYRWRVAGQSAKRASTHPLALWSEALRRAVIACPP
jgi:hypothetical protein